MAVAETQYSQCFDVFYVALVHGGRSAEGNCRRNNYFEAAGVVVEFQLIDLYLFIFFDVAIEVRVDFASAYLTSAATSVLLIA